MLRRFYFVPVLLLVAIVQTTLLSALTIHNVKIDLMLMLVVAETTFRGTRSGMMWGFLGGLILDLFSVTPFGALALILPLVALVAGLMTGESLRHRFMLPMLLVFLTSLLQGGLLVLSLQLADRPVFWNASLLSIIAQSAALNTAVMPLVYLAFRRWRPMTSGDDESRWSFA